MKAAVLYLRRAIGPTMFGDCVRDLVIEDLLPTKLHPQGRRVIEDRWQSLPALYLNLGRNELVRHFLDAIPGRPEIFFSLDDDHLFQPWQFYDLVSLLDPVVRPILSGLYFAHNGEESCCARPVILRRNEAGKTKTVWKYRPDALEEVDSVGMGFCAIHRSKLEEWRAKHGDTWFDFKGGGKTTGFRLEDAAFCERMQSIGAKIHVHTGIIVGHLKTKVIGESDFAQRQALVAAVEARRKAAA